MNLLTVEDKMEFPKIIPANRMRSNILYSCDSEETETSSGPVGINLWSPEADRR